MCMFCRSLFVLLSFFFWPLWCLFFFDIRILITPLVSSNSSYRILKYYLKQCALNVLVKCWYFICIYMYRYPVSLLCNHTIQQFVSHLRQVGGFLRVLRYNWNIVAIDVKYHKPSPCVTALYISNRQQYGTVTMTIVYAI